MMYRLGVGCQNPHRSLSASDSFHANELGGGVGAKKKKSPQMFQKTADQ